MPSRAGLVKTFVRSSSRVVKKSFVHGTYPDPKVIGTESNREHRSIFQQPASGQFRPDPDQTHIVRFRTGTQRRHKSLLQPPYDQPLKTPCRAFSSTFEATATCGV